MNNVSKTLYIPLYGKAYVSKKNIIINDSKAEEIWANNPHPKTRTQYYRDGGKPKMQ